jgi:arginyl-tRNA synthetase
MGLHQKLLDSVIGAVQACQRDGTLPAPEEGLEPAAVEIEAPRPADSAEYSTGIALALARRARCADRARSFAESIAAALNAEATSSGPLGRAEAAGGGYLLLHLRPGVLAGLVQDAVAAGPHWGRTDVGRGRRALVEFVSANPTVPITATHARGGAIGDSIASLLDWTGWRTEREFYVNDAVSSRPLKDFTRAALAHYRRHFGIEDAAPEASDPGTAVAVADTIARTEQGRFLSLPSDAALPAFRDAVLRTLTDRQERDLAALGVRFDCWFSEQSLHATGAVRRTLSALVESRHTHAEGDALWLRARALGDETDRVLVRADGSPTYLAGDLAYHADKFERGFDLLVDVWSADHAGYVGRTRAGLAALGYEPDRLKIVFAAPVRVLRDGVDVKSNGIAGGASQPVTLEETLADIDPDAARFLLLLKAGDVPVDLHIDLGKMLVRGNPLREVRSVLARCTAIAADRSLSGDPDEALRLRDAVALARSIATFPDETCAAAAQFAPDRIARYVVNLAGLAHTWLERSAVAGGDASKSVSVAASLAAAAQITLTNSLRLLGVAPDAAAG